jgi:maltooligosyltrehalose trehalohydrolase
MRGPHLGATLGPEGVTFAAWTTTASKVAVRIYAESEPTRLVRTEPLEARGDGLFARTFPDVRAGALYRFDLDEREVPDPYALFLPYGVHGPARVEAPLEPRRPFEPPPLSLAVIYELHVGTFTPEGTYAAAAERLGALAELGVTYLELMPLSAFAGERGWGYDGVAAFAPFAPYGTPRELRRFIEAAHALGMGVLLDVVYNHLGPAGAYLAQYAPEYLTKTAGLWGEAPDLSHPRARAYALESARRWLDEIGFDGLRLDATDTLQPGGAPQALRALVDLAHGMRPPRLVIAEDARNDQRLVTDLGIDAIWADDFHHQVRVLVTGERDGYYAAYEPTLAALARVIERGWIYEGQRYAPTGKPRGGPSDALGSERFVYYVQNHDQIGNRATGTRLSHDAPIEAFAGATALLLFLPMTPLLFMGQEWAASTPFLFFTDHEEPLGSQVSRGRREEFKSFAAFAGEVPDPQARETFLRSKLDWSERARAPHADVLELVKTMLLLRRTDPVLADRGREARARLRAEVVRDLLVVRRWNEHGARVLVWNPREKARELPSDLVGQTPLLETRPGGGARLPPWAAVISA